MPFPFIVPKNLPHAIERGLGKAGFLSPQILGKANPSYEQITCVGYHPQFEELFAVISLKQPGGYGGDVCSPGTLEYVRFYMSFDNGASWRDMGVTTCPAYDLGAAAPVDAAVALHVDAPAFPCANEAANIVRVRAILSWAVEPTPNMPNYTPSWGNVVDVSVQLEPVPLPIIQFVPVPKVTTALKGGLLASLGFKGKTGESLALIKPQVAPVAARPDELVKKALAAKVPAHRAVTPFLKLAKADVATFISPSVASVLAAAKIDFGSITAALAGPSNDTSFEELTCVGLDTFRRQLVGVLQVKKPGGYSGSLCQSGSKEYVAFWVDWGTGTYQYMGTTAVTAHDIASITTDGLRYAVSLPLNWSDHARLCAAGPNTVKVRGVLSWANPPSATDPNDVPHFGNRKDAKVLIPNAAQLPQGTMGEFQAAGRIALGDIGSNGFTKSTSAKPTVVTITGTGNSFRSAPFGGQITLHGQIHAPAGTRYRFQFRELNPSTQAPLGPFAPLVANFPTATSVRQLVGINLFWVPLGCDANGFYTVVPNTEDILAIWYTNASMSDRLYELYLEVDGETISETNRPKYRIFVSNTGPTAILTVPNPVDDKCTDKTQGENVTGTLTARADYFEVFSFLVLPQSPSHFPGGNPAGFIDVRSGGSAIEAENWDYPDIETNEGLPQGIVNGTYSLPTGALPAVPGVHPATPGMNPCGYSMTVVVWSRTNFDSGTKRAASDSVGFCVKPTP